MRLLVVVPGSDCPFGIAYPAGLAERGARPAATFRLLVGNTEVRRRWLCVGREFVHFKEAPKEL
jgi:hypothetical protein